jgi:hypothetical protein
MAAPVPAIHVFAFRADCKDVDARHKAGHDENTLVSLGIAMSPHPEVREARLEG